jgi:hypothetical protein
VQWLGRGYFVLRIAVDEASRWCLGSGLAWDDVYPHERIFKRSAAEKAESIRLLRMNPWPVHVACDAEPADWSAYFASLTRGVAPVLDTGYMTLWRLSELPRLSELLGPRRFIVLDGHHSRRAQQYLKLKRMLGWLEPLAGRHLQVRSIDRAGWLAKHFEAWLREGVMERLERGPAEAEWTMGRSQAIEVVQPDKRFWARVVKPDDGEAAVDALARLAKGRAFMKASANFEEIVGWLQRLEVDTGLRLPSPTKEYVRERALARRTLPQKSTYFFPKIPFGVLVEDLS